MPVNVGFDLGTTNSLAARYHDGSTHMIPNALGDVLTPSAVAVDASGAMLVGAAALDRWRARPDCGTVAFKRLMGTPRSIRVGLHLFKAEDPSAMVLKSLLDDAVADTAKRGETIGGVVVTVPAYFSNAQREAVRLACRLSGIPLMRLLNEPTAAALAYGLHSAPARSLIMVLDLGGGTFDVAILRCHDGLMEVCASAGENRLGGEDFVEALVNHVAAAWSDLPDRQLDPLLNTRLWVEGERVKRALSAAESAEFSLEWAGQLRLRVVTQADFAAVVAPLMARLRGPIERALRDAKLRAADLHQVVLAGGATRMPLVRQMVVRMFGRMPAMNLNPDEVVARGAAVLAAMLGNDQSLEEVVMTDVCPYSLGIEVVREQADGRLRDGYHSVLIERNTPLPVSREECFVTAQDQQAAVTFNVYQGEGRMVADNILLGTLTVPVPARPAGEVSLAVRFTFDVSGILEMQVKQPDGGLTRNLVLQSGHESMTDEQVALRLATLAALKVHPRDQQVNQAVKARAERLYEDLLGRQRDNLGQAIDVFDQALTSQDLLQIEGVRGRLKRLLDSLEQL